MKKAKKVAESFDFTAGIKNQYTKDMIRRFQSEPHKLVDYLECSMYEHNGRARKADFLGVFIMMLGQMVRVVPRWRGVVGRVPPPEALCSLADVENIDEILLKGKRDFPKQRERRLQRHLAGHRDIDCFE